MTTAAATASPFVNQTDVDEYWERGYWISPKIIDDETIAALREAQERIWAGEIDGDGHTFYGGTGAKRVPEDALHVRKLDNGWWINDEVRKLVTGRTLGEIGAALMRTREVRLWHDQVIYKPGQGLDGKSTSGNVGWHQDLGYWQCSSTSNMCTAWLALQDTDLTNGGMRSIVRSHEWGLIEDSNTFFDQDLDSLKDKYHTDERDWIDEPCIMKAGEASFHHALTFHGSGPNLTDHPRLSIVAHLMPEDCAYGGREKQYHSNVKLLGPRPRAGQKFAGEYFPVLYRAK